MRPNQTLGFEEMHRFLGGLFNRGRHASRLLPLANATLGVIMTASLAVSIFGRRLALARGLTARRAIKPVDRLLSDQHFVNASCHRRSAVERGDWHRCRAPPLGSLRRGIACQHQGGDACPCEGGDRTDFGAGGQTTIMLSLMTRHGRTTPLAWLTVDADTLKNNRNEYEYQILVRFADALPAGIKVSIAAGRASATRSSAGF
jgi:hypothetical protein